ncbi:IS5 family transposase ISMra2 [Methylobacterium organophilum]|uniref:IS5 family transposase ISMra2 n=1 Tax=Methylobacterium organophilum TaxID=410 RepID=A0ABQ4TAD2_METOR|nr:IS5 family transposase ISMra2 [Methylobacterium organophilum]
MIPICNDQPRQPDFDKAAYRERSELERLIGRLEQYRRIATRYEKRAANYLAMVTLGMTMLWLI